MAKVYKADGTVEELDIPSGQELGYEICSSLVGGMIQVLPTPEGSEYDTLVCNEEGKLKGLPINEKATNEFRSVLLPGDVLVGDVFVCNTDLEEGTMLA